MAILSINYDNNNVYDETGETISIDLTYHYVQLSTFNGEFKFNSGNFVKDWYQAKKKYNEMMDDEPFLSLSSTCDHFIMDGAKYYCAYLHIVNDKPILKYMDDSKPLHTQKNIFEDGYEFFVEENTKPSWKELKEYCK